MKVVGLLSGLGVLSYALMRFVPDWYQKHEAWKFEKEIERASPPGNLR